ncbi:uncharacterized protein LOC125223869 isoform X2 [Salvia hispanica]|uniref:uncharacterized protein LOC125223869 isoform X2 n=1 Tax=Salvia hispanica TaxID=49212 RepID=UPI002009C65F|nr:uncharacterized protein LOC125223869 isoform X2 [Salvia hispanica]
MERTTFLVRYKQNQNTSFYLCRHCQTHLALHHELLHKYAANQHALFQNLVNVGLGANYKIISLSIETSAIKAGRFMIDMTKLLFWKGNQMLCADTEQPVQDV